MPGQGKGSPVTAEAHPRRQRLLRLRLSSVTAEILIADWSYNKFLSQIGASKVR